MGINSSTISSNDALNESLPSDNMYDDPPPPYEDSEISLPVTQSDIIHSIGFSQKYQYPITQIFFVKVDPNTLSHDECVYIIRDDLLMYYSETRANFDPELMRITHLYRSHRENSSVQYDVIPGCMHVGVKLDYNVYGIYSKIMIDIHNNKNVEFNPQYSTNQPSLIITTGKISVNHIKIGDFICGIYRVTNIKHVLSNAQIIITTCSKVCPVTIYKSSDYVKIYRLEQYSVV